MFKVRKERAALKAVLRLLVFLREAMKAEGAKDTTLYKSVVDHANLVGQVLPNKDRVSGEELEKLLTMMKQGGGIPEKDGAEWPDVIGATSPGPDPKAVAQALRTLPKPGQMIVLTPEQLGGGKKGGLIT